MLENETGAPSLASVSQSVSPTRGKRSTGLLTGIAQWNRSKYFFNGAWACAEPLASIAKIVIISEVLSILFLLS